MAEERDIGGLREVLYEDVFLEVRSGKLEAEK